MSSEDVGLLPCLFRGVLGMRESVVSGSGRRQWFFFWVGGIGNGKSETYVYPNTTYTPLHGEDPEGRRPPPSSCDV